MQSAQAYLVGLAILLAAAAAFIALVRKPLHAILIELCGADHRASFWERLYDAAVVLAVLTLSLWAPPQPSGPDETITFLDYFGLMRAGSLALLGSLGVLAVLMIFFIQQHDRRRNRRVQVNGLGD